ncbi:hypothetical protein BT96DRAFT_568622 [Gymnopus androsaceus JB14]|uniref:Uncharacterized protein n=1 Tax=Gymnopus androsaceus JB14 TaxID=1447944 RepID=A0A6A4GJZ8_9AGAR|nr:hypothetical protein BT96DRAFT_568622 [Gymnopus androsaceus JB14]
MPRNQIIHGLLNSPQTRPGPLHTRKASHTNTCRAPQRGFYSISLLRRCTITASPLSLRSFCGILSTQTIPFCIVVFRAPPSARSAPFLRLPSQMNAAVVWCSRIVHFTWVIRDKEEREKHALDERVEDLAIANEPPLDAEIKKSRLPAHMQLLLFLSSPPQPSTLAYASLYLDALGNPTAPAESDQLTWKKILDEDPYKGDHWVGVPGGIPLRKRRASVYSEDNEDLEDDLDVSPSLSPLDSDDLALDVVAAVLDGTSGLDEDRDQYDMRDFSQMSCLSWPYGTIFQRPIPLPLICIPHCSECSRNRRASRPPYAPPLS